MKYIWIIIFFYFERKPTFNRQVYIKKKIGCLFTCKFEFGESRNCPTGRPSVSTLPPWTTSNAWTINPRIMWPGWDDMLTEEKMVYFW